MKLAYSYIFEECLVPVDYSHFQKQELSLSGQITTYLHRVILDTTGSFQQNIMLWKMQTSLKCQISSCVIDMQLALLEAIYICVYLSKHVFACRPMGLFFSECQPKSILVLLLCFYAVQLTWCVENCTQTLGLKIKQSTEKYKKYPGVVTCYYLYIIKYN